jgi:hypothetical protein
MTTVAAPIVEEEMDDWEKLGGTDLGIVGDLNHNYGFHLGANRVPPEDYSRYRDPNGAFGPYIDWDYACAGDFGHSFEPKLMTYHRNVLNGLMTGKHPMICEFIGKPWEDRPVYYWARWNGITTLQKYTGVGHDKWSHISWYRSEVDKKANLWVGGHLSILNLKVGDKGSAVKLLQERLERAGYPVMVDGKALNVSANGGVFNLATKTAMNKFRAAHNLPALDYVSYWTAVELEDSSKRIVSNLKLATELRARAIAENVADITVDSLPDFVLASEMKLLIAEAVEQYFAAHKDSLRGEPGTIELGTEITIENIGKVTKIVNE